MVQVSGASVGYEAPVLEGVAFALAAGERLALVGRNGCGKSTLARAILGDPAVWRSGDWMVPDPAAIGYLDQHYANLAWRDTALAAVERVTPIWSLSQRRHHLADFLLRGEQLVQTRVGELSGGERARLALACIASRVPDLLILDEITNNLDLRTLHHVVDVLREYPGAMILISHDDDFLAAIGAVCLLQLGER